VICLSGSDALVGVMQCLAALQKDGRLGLMKLDISGCPLTNEVLSTVGRLRLCELGLWGGVEVDHFFAASLSNPAAVID
jgi:hypothetical protein